MWLMLPAHLKHSDGVFCDCVNLVQKTVTS